MNPLITLTLILCSSLCSGQHYNRGYHQLDYRDFQGKRPVGDIMVAANLNTELDFGTGSEHKSEWGLDVKDTVFSFNAFVRFNPENSYITVKDSYILKHEQGHLDIDQICANRANKIANLEKRYSTEGWLLLKQSFIEGWHKMDSTYDAETMHSLDHAGQAKWNEKIQKLIQ